MHDRNRLFGSSSHSCIDSRANQGSAGQVISAGRGMSLKDETKQIPRFGKPSLASEKRSTEVAYPGQQEVRPGAPIGPIHGAVQRLASLREIVTDPVCVGQLRPG